MPVAMDAEKDTFDGVEKSNVCKISTCMFKHWNSKAKKNSNQLNVFPDKIECKT